MFELRQYNLRHGPLCYNCVNTTYVTAHYVRITYMVRGHFMTHYMVRRHFVTHYSQLPPCGHLAITDTPLLRTAAKSPAKVTDV